MQYSADGYMQQCVDRYLEHTGMQAKDSKFAETPGMDDNMFKPNEWIDKGELSGDAAKIIMKILYGARFYRWDLIRDINYLARKRNKWTNMCDRRVYRLICYINSTKDWMMHSVIGDAIEDCTLICYADADFASDTEESKSTNGGYVVLVGPNTWAPIACVCKAQTSVSHSSTESEVISLDYVLRTEGVPILSFLQHVASVMSFKETKTRGGEIPAKTIKMYVIEDNDACIKIVLKKRSMALRHVMRTHRVALDWMYELFDSEDIWLKYINTKWQVADM